MYKIVGDKFYCHTTTSDAPAKFKDEFVADRLYSLYKDRPVYVVHTHTGVKESTLKENRYSSSSVKFIPYTLDFSGDGPEILDYIAEEGNSAEFLSFDDGFLVHTEDFDDFNQLIQSFASY